MDKLDDKVVEVKSTALYFENSTKPFCYLLCLFMFGLIYKALNSHKKTKDSKQTMTNLKNLLLIVSVLYQANLVRMTNLNEPFSCLKSFQKSRNFGLLILLTCLIYKIDKVE
jgi:hypothetical protein